MIKDTEWLGMRIRNITWKLQPTSETSLFSGPRSYESIREQVIGSKLKRSLLSAMEGIILPTPSRCTTSERTERPILSGRDLYDEFL